MDNKTELLEKLGFSKEYLKMLSQDNAPFELQDNDQLSVFIESEIIDNKMTTLIIEKSDKPINKHFIYNENEK